MSGINTTIVISNYNYVKYVGSAIDSCLAQTVPCRIIVVDDVSKDKSWKVISKYARNGRVSGVKLKSNSRGNARGKNVGICMSNTEFIICLDSDDMLVPWSVEKRLECLEDEDDFVHGWAKVINTKADYSSLIKVHEDTLSGPVRLSKKVGKIELENSEVRWTWAIQASTVLARKSMYEKYGLYDEEMRWSIDREMWWRCLSHGAKRRVLSKYVSIYRNHPAQVTRNPKVKNPKKHTKQLIARKESRAEINSDTTLMMSDYDYESFVECTV